MWLNVIPKRTGKGTDPLGRLFSTASRLARLAVLALQEVVVCDERVHARAGRESLRLLEGNERAVAAGIAVLQLAQDDVDEPLSGIVDAERFQGRDGLREVDALVEARVRHRLDEPALAVGRVLGELARLLVLLLRLDGVGKDGGEVVLAHGEARIGGHELFGELDVGRSELEALDARLQLGQELLRFRRLRGPFEMAAGGSGRRGGGRDGGARSRGQGREQTESRNPVHAFTPLNR